MNQKYLRIEHEGETLVVSPLFTFAAFAEPDVKGEWIAVQAEIETADIKHVVVDLGNIPYFGSTVLEWMVQMWKRTKAKGGKFATCNASPIGQEVLNAAHFDKLWGLFNSRAEALHWLGNPQA